MLLTRLAVVSLSHGLDYTKEAYAFSSIEYYVAGDYSANPVCSLEQAVQPVNTINQLLVDDIAAFIRGDQVLTTPHTSTFRLMIKNVLSKLTAIMPGWKQSRTKYMLTKTHFHSLVCQESHTHNITTYCDSFKGYQAMTSCTLPYLASQFRAETALQRLREIKALYQPNNNEVPRLSATNSDLTAQKYAGISHGFQLYSEYRYALTKQLLTEEPSTNIFNLNCESCAEEIKHLTINGYELIYTISYIEIDGNMRIPIPYVGVFKKRHHICISVAMPYTVYMARFADYNQLVPFRTRMGQFGEVHGGSALLVESLIPILESYLTSLDDHVNRTTLVTRGQLGNSIGSSLVLYLSTLLPTITMEQASFGNIYVGNTSFSSAVSSRPNVIITNTYLTSDSSDLFGCAITRSCSEKLLPSRTGVTDGIVYRYNILPVAVVSKLVPDNPYASLSDPYRSYVCYFFPALAECAEHTAYQI